MTAELSMDYVVECSLRRGHKFIARSILSGKLLAMFSQSGSGKTTMTDQLAATITPDMLVNHPLNLTEGEGAITHVQPYDLPSPMYDGISFRGPIIAGESYDCPVTGRRRVLSDLASPVWYTEVLELLGKYPNAHVLIKIDEINLADEDYQSMLLVFLDRLGIGPHQFNERDRKRISFILMGNPPEALPSKFVLSGPLAQRVHKWIKVKTDNTDVKQFLEERGELAPEVEWMFNEYPDIAECAGVNDDGKIPGLDIMNTGNNPNDSGAKPSDTFLTPIVNGISPRKWHAVSLELIAMRHDPEYADMKITEKREELHAMVHPSIADLLINSMELMDTFATMEQVQADAMGAKIPDGALLQSMQIRSLLPRLDDTNVAAFIKYADRFGESERSGIMAFLIRQMQNTQANKRMSGLQGAMGTGGLKISSGTMSALSRKYLKGTLQNVAQAIGTEDLVLSVAMDDEPAVQAPPAQPPAPPVQPAFPAPPVQTPAQQAKEAAAVAAQQAPTAAPPPPAVAPVAQPVQPVPVQPVQPVQPVHAAPINVAQPAQAPAPQPAPSVTSNEELEF